MIIKHPKKENISSLKALWVEAFGEEELSFYETFLGAAYSPKRCLAAFEGEKLCAALYWFDCSCRGKKLAYMYGVATFLQYRGKGVCRALMDEAKQILRKRGYQGIVLVPANPSLYAFYEKLGFLERLQIDEFMVERGDEEIPLKKIGKGEYARLRRKELVEGGVLQEKENLKFLKTQFDFYKGEGVLLAVRKEKELLFCGELLGDKSLAPNILKTLGFAKGKFRTVGGGRDYAVYYPLAEGETPTHFAFAFD